MHIKDKQVLIFNGVFDLLWTSRGSSVSTVALVGLCDLKSFIYYVYVTNIIQNKVSFLFENDRYRNRERGGRLKKSKANN